MTNLATPDHDIQLDTGRNEMTSIPRTILDSGSVTALAEQQPPSAEAVADVRNQLATAVEEHVLAPPGFVIVGDLSDLDEPAIRRFVVNASSALGHLLPQNREGAQLWEVYDRSPSRDQREARFSESRKSAGMHTDGMHVPDQPIPDLFTLTCVRTAETGGELSVVRLDEVLNALPEHAAETLRTPVHFAVRGIDPRGRQTVPRPVLCDVDGKPAIAYAREYIDSGHLLPGIAPLTAEQSASFDTLDTLIESEVSRTSYRLRRGEMIIVNNREILHGRSAFQDDESHPGRLMLRTWISTRTPPLDTSAG